MSASVGNKINTSESASGYSGVEEHSAPMHAFLEYSTFLIFPVLFGLNLHWAGTHLYVYELAWLIALAIPIGIVGGDFISGVVHWAADTYCSEDTPIVGPSLVKPFRQHHLYPRDICTHNLVETVGNVCILAVPVLALCLYLLWLLPESSWMAFAAICVALMSAATVATNQFHKWAHSENPPAFARPLQRLRLVLEPSHHELHHTAPFESHYCITNGWLNPLLNRIKFFRRLERALAFVGINTAKVNDMKRAQQSS
jgi:ubiquitin-conjugating enzyme E2 variant